MKKKIALVLTMAMLGSCLAGCGQNAADDSASAEQKESTAVAQSTEAAQGKKQGRRNGSVPMTARPLRFVCGAAYSRNMDTMKCAQTLMSSTKTRAYR